jgi:hypothetical protein
MVEFSDDFVYFLPLNFLRKVEFVFEIKYYFFKRIGPLYFRESDCWAIDQISIDIVILNLLVEGLDVNCLIAEGIERIEYILKLLPVFLL